jgi:hypothetical protein
MERVRTTRKAVERIGSPRRKVRARRSRFFLGCNLGGPETQDLNDVPKLLSSKPRKIRDQDLNYVSKIAAKCRKIRDRETENGLSHLGILEFV